jgi:hypothetical protein
MKKTDKTVKKDALYDEPKDVKTVKDVKLWHERVSLAKKAKDAWCDSSGANRFVEGYKGKFDLFFQNRQGKIKVPPINEIFAYVQSDIASTYNRDPYITVNPKAGTVLGAKLREVRLNYWWRELGIKEELELEIIDKDLVGSAWHKVGMSFNSVGSGDQLKIEDEKLYSMRVDWKDLFWGMNAKRPPKDCQWMAQRIIRPLDDIKAKYPAAKGLEGCPNPEVDKSTYDNATYKDDIKVGVMYEIWDARSKQIYLIAEGMEERYLEEPRPWPDYLDEFPFLQYWDFWTPGSAYPMSAIAPWEAQILEEMTLLAQAVNHAKRWNRQAWVKNPVDENALDKFERGDDGAIVVANGDVGPDSLRFVDFGPLPVDFYLLMDRLQAIKRNIHGQPEFARGGVTKTSTRTIGELQLMSQGAKGRDERKIDRLETHLENIARHMDAHLQANFDIEETIKVTGETPEEVLQALGSHYNPITHTVTYTPKEIKGDYDIDIKAGSTLPLDKQNRQQMMEVILQAIAPIAPNGFTSPFLNALLQEILRDYDIKSLQEAYQQELAQAQQRAQQAAEEGDIEKEKVKAEAQKRSAQAEQVHVDTEMAAQELFLGPVGRAQVERMKKPEPKPVGAK